MADGDAEQARPAQFDGLSIQGQSIRTIADGHVAVNDAVSDVVFY